MRLGKNGEPEINENTSNNLTGAIRELTDGTDLTVLSTGAITFNCLIAAKELNDEMKIQVISVPKVQPISYEYLFQLIASPKVLVVEEHVERGGFASAILESMNRDNQLMKFHHVFISEINIAQTGSQEFLRKLSGLDQESLKNTFRNLVKN